MCCDADDGCGAHIDRLVQLQRKQQGGLSHKPQFNGLTKRRISNGATDSASLFTKQGLKGINQDAMLVAENFAAQRGMVLCGVFDGHGVDGHHVARSIRDMLQQKLTTSWRCQRQVLRESSHSLDKDYDEDLCSEKFSSEFLAVDTWKEALKMTFNLMDEELLTQHGIDSISSGTTAVVLVKQGNDLAVGNVGDSRAVLGAKADDGSLIAVQLTIDHKPEIPKRTLCS